MRKRRHFFCLFLSLLVFSSLLSARINLSSSAADSLTPAIAVDSRGRILVVWAEMDWPIPGIADILYRTNGNSQWSAALESISQLYDARFPSLAVDNQDVFHMTYQDGPTLLEGDAFYRTFNFFDMFWSNIERIHRNPQASSTPAITVSPGGIPHVLWVHVFDEAGHSRIVMKTRESAGWPEKFISVSKNTANSSTYPSAAEKNGILFAAWEDDRTGTPEIFLNEKIAAFWGAPLQVTSQGVNTRPALAVDLQNGIHILYSSGDSSVFHIRRRWDAWKIPVLLSSGTSPAGAKDLAVSKNNILHAVWKQIAGGNTRIFYSRGTPQGTWLKPVQVALGKESDSPRLCITDNDEVHVVWTDKGIGEKRDVYLKTLFLPGTRPSAHMASSFQEGIVPLSVQFDASGSAAGDGQVLSSWWYFGDQSAPTKGTQVTHTFSSPGVYTVSLFVTNSGLLSSVASTQITVLAGPYPPTNIQVVPVEEGGLFWREKINVVSWTPNPKNTAPHIVSTYRIYRKLKTEDRDAFTRIGQATAGRTVFSDRDFVFPQDRNLYDYGVSSVDGEGREGPIGAAGISGAAGASEKKQ